MQRKTKQLSLGSVLLLAIFLTLTFDTRPTSAFSLNITTSGPISTNVIPASDGSIGTSIVTDEINITSNCRSGYTFTIASPSDNNLYLNGDDTNNTSGTYFTPVNGTNALNHTANTNKWGYTLTNDATSSTVFSPLSSTATTLRTPAQTASPSSDIDHTIPIHYGTAVDGTMNPGSYTFANNGTITYTVTMDPSCLNYSVQYQGNNPDNPNGMGTTDESTGEKSVRQTNISEGTTITLLAPNFKKQGYGFLGWSTDEDAYNHFIDNDNTNNPVIYGPMETVTIDSDIIATANARNQINMYAIWLPALRTDPSDSTSTPVYFQDWDNPNTQLPHDGCSTLTQTIFDDTETNEKDKIKVSKDSVVALTDKRDNEVYTVAKLADGKCWMTENLRLDAEYTRGNNINDPTVTNQYLSQGYGGTTGTYGNFVGLAEAESTSFGDSTSNSVYKSSANPPADIYNPLNDTLEDIGITDYPGHRIPRYNNNNTTNELTQPTYVENYTNPTRPSVSGEYKASRVLSYGNYYTWHALMASTNYVYSSTNSEPFSTSICPAGWYPPTSGNTDKQYSTLSKSYGGDGGTQSDSSAGNTMTNRFRSFPNNYLYSGYYLHASSQSVGSHGRYWTKSSEGWNNSYNLFFSANGIEPNNVYYKYGGVSVRCISSDSDTEIILDSNNATGAVSRLYGVAEEVISLPQSSIADPVYKFKNWNTSPDGSGTTYTNSYTIPAGSTGETLYAQWTPQYTIIYVNNCMSWTNGDINCNQTKSDSTLMQRINLDTSGNGSGTLGAYNKFTMTGWKIKEWTTNADGTGSAYPVNTSYSVTGASAGDSIALYAHWLPIYTVQYDGNGSDNDNTGMGSTNATTGIKTVKHTNVAEGDTFDLFASNFKRAGYGFVGWSTDQDAWNKLTDNDASNDAKIWGPNETITAPAYNGTPITTLYAVWAPAEKDGNNNPVYLQNWTGCSAMTATAYDGATGTLSVAKNSVTALTDQRDGNVYAIAKLADDNCWMVENLRLADTHEENGNTVATTLTASNTNIDINNSTLPITNIYNSDPLQATKSDSLSQSSSVAYNASTAPYGWCNTSSAACNNQSRLNTANTVANITPSQTQSVTSANAHVNLGVTLYSYGNYYNWYSATAGYGTHSSVNYREPTAGDLCPSGWRLPYGGTGIGNTKGSFYYLAGQMSATSSNRVNSNKFRMFPNNFIFSGRHAGDTTSERGGAGRYWSGETNTTVNFAYRLYLSNTSNGGAAMGSEYNEKYYGYTIRCVTGL